MKAKYRDGIQIHDPGRLGSVLITAVDPTVTTASLCAEFELEQLDDYLDRARTHRAATINSKG
jgi:hypothetical protein